MLSVGDIMSQFREQFKQGVGRLQESNQEVRTSVIKIDNTLNVSTVTKILRTVLTKKKNNTEDTQEDPGSAPPTIVFPPDVELSN